MIRTFSAAGYRDLCDDLAARDRDLRRVLENFGYPPMWTRPNTFETLVHIILEQQVSLASALAALNKLRQQLGTVAPEAFLQLSDETLRACYFSRQKTAYVRILAEALVSGAVSLHEMEQLPDEEVRKRLGALKGIGNWTIDVYLMFALQRVDLFPVGDLAAVNAMKTLKSLPRETKRDTLTGLAGGWAPYRTVATMILWHFYLSSRKPARR
ncbi:DNA-3-methyladenine glycosylase 2 family protein [Pedobacter yulinensis]|uniref:DNA-3-methyladenine glycosylase II n=1 Tax=Pedobacter yulinensis TaxID=2126353 RepID=A0A2T3HNC4_9SPHI|nr:DNA-3-methyladenine glycosylase [Pedobacter yulinensis]PST83958.1 DNA-3-methyladenine glycosylase 2 family protein [Pedobacter yulinensis]